MSNEIPREFTVSTLFLHKCAVISIKHDDLIALKSIISLIPINYVRYFINMKVNDVSLVGLAKEKLTIADYLINNMIVVDDCLE